VEPGIGHANRTEILRSSFEENRVECETER